MRAPRPRVALAAATLACALTAATGCSKQPPAPAVGGPAEAAAPPAPPPKPESPRTTVRAGLPMLEHFLNGADETSPVVVVIHGMGDRPDSFVAPFSTFPATVRVVFPRAPRPYGGGFSWFTFDPSMSDADFGREVGEADRVLFAALTELLGPTRRFYVMGFSQGGFLAFAAAAQHPDRVLAAFPVAGSLPGPLHPKPLDAGGRPAAPVFAFHGEADAVVQLRWGQETVDSFRAKGSEATIRTYPGVGHTIPEPERKDIQDAILAALARDARGG